MYTNDNWIINDNHSAQCNVTCVRSWVSMIKDELINSKIFENCSENFHILVVKEYGCHVTLTNNNNAVWLTWNVNSRNRNNILILIGTVDLYSQQSFTWYKTPIEWIDKIVK